MEPIPPKCDCNRYNRLRLCVDPARLPPPPERRSPQAKCLFSKQEGSPGYLKF